MKYVKTAKDLLIALATRIGASFGESPRQLHRRRLEGNPKYQPGEYVASLPDEERELLRHLTSDDLANVNFQGDLFTEQTEATKHSLSDLCLEFDRKNKLV